MKLEFEMNYEKTNFSEAMNISEQDIAALRNKIVKICNKEKNSAKGLGEIIKNAKDQKELVAMLIMLVEMSIMESEEYKIKEASRKFAELLKIHVMSNNPANSACATCEDKNTCKSYLEKVDVIAKC